MMKKMLICSLAALLMLSSCGSYQAAGAYTGAQFGSIIGSAIGGISGGWRGHDVGALVGLAGGAVVGAAVGAAADNASKSRQPVYDASGRGDDRIMMDATVRSGYNTIGPASLEISHVAMIDASRDGHLTRGEAAHVVFEITNTSSEPLYSVQPSVREVSGNKHIHISENILVECIKPRETIRYTAQVKADNGLRNGEAFIRVAVFQAGREVASQTRDLRIVTSKR